MTKFKILTKPTRLSDLSFDDLYDDISSDWELKAKRMQKRRWNKLREEMA
jgi:hypothetical protein